MNTRITEDPSASFVGRVGRWTSLFVTLSMALLIALLAARVMELLYVLMKHGAPSDLSNVLPHALLFDLAWFLKLLAVFVVPFLIVCFALRSATARYWAYGVVGSVVIFSYTLLIKYFTTARVPLGADLFAYSVPEITGIIRTSAAIDAFTVGLVAIPLLLFWGSLAWLRVRKPVSPGYAAVIVGLGWALHGTSIAAPVPTAFETEFSYNLASNKMAVFAGESYAYVVRAVVGDRPSESDPTTRSPGRVARLTYVNPEYPFLRQETTPDVLGEFFNLDPAKPPNVVVLLVEGLGKAFSGPNAYLESFTPFLDELAGKSLYWENFLASQGRTFAVLPSVLASLPYGEQGFNAFGKNMPNHHSLLSVLKHNGYRTKFYSGSDQAFDLDNQRLFIARQRVDVVVTEQDFDARYNKNPDTGWGYPDRELLRKALEVEQRDFKEPYVSVLQTMSMHSPFLVPDQDSYMKLFEERMNHLGLDEAAKQRHRADANIYAAILYADDALRHFFDEYQKLPAYGNTIFILTGDHRLPEIPMSTKIDRFHVPLIIFSPLLKRAVHFESISSHLDITPSLLALFRERFDLRTPSTVAWVGSGLDTDPTFRNIHAYPLKHTKNNLIDFISGMSFIDQDVLFTVSKHMDLEPTKNDREKNRLTAEFDDYKSRNNQFIRDLKLIPDTHYEQFYSR
ncbi:MAG: LTA synthase family protein [Nitrospirota bacterium]